MNDVMGNIIKFLRSRPRPFLKFFEAYTDSLKIINEGTLQKIRDADNLSEIDESKEMLSYVT